MSNMATVTLIPGNNNNKKAGFTAFAIIQVKFSNVHICLWTFFAYPTNPHLFLAKSRHVFPSTIHFNLHTALLPKWWRTCFTHKPMFLSWPWVFPLQPFLQTSYTLTLDIASLIHYIFQNHLQSCPTLCDPMACSPPGSSVHGILQGIHWSGKNTCPPPEDLPGPGIKPASRISCIGRWVLYH